MKERREIWKGETLWPAIQKGRPVQYVREAMQRGKNMGFTAKFHGSDMVAL